MSVRLGMAVLFLAGRRQAVGDHGRAACRTDWRPVVLNSRRQCQLSRSDVSTQSKQVIGVVVRFDDRTDQFDCPMSIKKRSKRTRVVLHHVAGLSYRSEPVVRNEKEDFTGGFYNARQLAAEPVATDHMFEDLGRDRYIELRFPERHMQQVPPRHRNPFGRQAFHGIFGLLEAMQLCEAAIAQIPKNTAGAAADIDDRFPVDRQSLRSQPLSPAKNRSNNSKPRPVDRPNIPANFSSRQD